MSGILTNKERAKKLDNINTNISIVSDDELPDILSIINKAMNKKIKDKCDLTRFEIIQLIEKNIKYCNDRDINQIEAIIFREEETEEEILERVALEVTNKFLKVLGKPKIDTLCDFVLTRDEFMKDDVAKVIEDDMKYIFENGFDKKKCKGYKSKVIHKHASIFRGMLKQLNYALIHKTKFKTKNYVKTPYTMYYISKTEKGSDRDTDQDADKDSD
jgi:hypothetical protein